MGNVNVQGGALEFDAVINMQQFQAQLNRMEASLQGITQTAKEQSAAIEGFAKSAAVAIGSYISIAGTTNFIRDIVQVRGEFQQLEVAFTTMLKSKEKADQLMKQVTQLAATTPFSLQDVATASKQLLAYGFAAENLTDTIKMLGNVASGVGAPLGDIVYLYGTLQTQGRAYTKDIMQFTARGIPIIDQLAKQFGVTKDKVNDLVQAGKVGFPEVEKAFQSLTGEGGMFFNLMEEQSKTLTGQLSNLGDAVDQMLNDFGKSGEGIFSSIISGATTAVEHYQDVIDILKVLAVTYGTYKAAVIATAAVQAIQTAATQGYTIAEMLRYRAMLLSEGAMKLLNKTMLTNPYVAVATGLAAIVSAFVLFNKTASEVKTKSELIADAQEKIGDKLSETQAKIRPYQDALKKANITEQEKLDIYNKLKEIDPKIIDGIDAKTLSYDRLTQNVNIYLDALRKQYALEANKEALQASIKQEQVIEKQIKAQEKLINSRKESNKAFSGVIGGSSFSFSTGGNEAEASLATQKNKLDALKTQLAEQKKVSEELGQTQVAAAKKTEDATQRTLKIIDDEIAALKKQQQETSSTSKEYQDFQAKINKLEEERKRIVGESKQEIAAANKLESHTNSILQEREGILQSIADLQRDARQSGMVKEQSELDKINQKYDQAIGKIKEFNDKVDEFNRKNKTNVQKVGQIDIEKLNQARSTELDNARLKQDAERFRKQMENEKAIFEQYEEAKKNIGVEKADELFNEQTKGYTSYLEYLKSEAEKIAPKIVFGIANIGDIEKMKAITKEISDTEKKNEEESFKQRVNTTKRLLDQTASFNQQRLAYEKQYDKDVEALKKEFTGNELEERLKVLKEAKDADLKSLAETIAAHTEGWRTLNNNLVDFAKERIDQEIRSLEKILNTGNLDKETKRAIQAAINEWKDLRNQIDDSDDNLNQFISNANKVASIFNEIGNAVDGVNSTLGESLKLISSMIAGVAQTASAWKDFKDARDKQKDGSGSLLDTIVAGGGVVGAAFGVINAIVGVFKKAKESKKEAQAQIAAFNQAILDGEFAITQEYRQRQREQIKINKLKLEGIFAENKLLEEQKKSVANQYNDLLSQLQKQSAVVSETTKKSGGIFGIGAKTKVVQITESLAGKTYEELEQLFAKGQLKGQAKELFEELQKIKQEGADIDALLEENKKRAQEIFTGTTVDSLVDTIADGFRNGLSSAADFAQTFEDLMRAAMINALKYQYLEPALKEFYDEFAAASQSDNSLTQSEIDNLKNLFDSIITDADQKFEQLQQITGVAGTSTASTNSLQGALRGMTEQTAELIAGQFGGMRLVGIDQLNVMKQALVVQQNIENNTAQTVIKLSQLTDKMQNWFTVQGIKIQ